jgi:hypothetical protein
MIADDLPKGVYGRVMAAGFGYIEIRDDDSFKIAELFLQLIKKHLDAIKMDYETELKMLSDDSEEEEPT